MKNSTEDTIFNIVIGSACNWKCPYCLQEDDSSINKNNDIKYFCTNFLKFLEDNYKNKPINRFTIWGGEPLLYFKEIKYLIDSLKEIPTLRKPRITTNGSLLTKEHIKYINNNELFINLSYHCGQLSEDKWKLALQIKDLHITSLVHHQELSWDNYFNKWQYLYHKYGRCLNWYIYPILYVNDIPKEYLFTKEDINIYFNNLKSYLKNLDNIFYKNAINSIIFTYYKKYLKHNLSNYCFNSNNYALDLKGNRYLCHHNFSTNNIVGNIFKKTIPIIPIEFKEPLLKYKSKQCQECKAYKICFGGCFRAKDPILDCYFNNKIYDFLKEIQQNYFQYFSDFEFLDEI